MAIEYTNIERTPVSYRLSRYSFCNCDQSESIRPAQTPKATRDSRDTGFWGKFLLLSLTYGHTAPPAHACLHLAYDTSNAVPPPLPFAQLRRIGFAPADFAINIVRPFSTNTSAHTRQRRDSRIYREYMAKWNADSNSAHSTAVHMCKHTHTHTATQMNHPLFRIESRSL